MIPTLVASRGLGTQHAGLGTVGASGSIIMTGTMTTDSPDETDIVTGGKTFILTVTNDTWVSFNDTIRRAILDGISSAQSETNGWNAEVRDKSLVGSVVRTNSTVCTVTLAAASAYDTSSDETITATVPASALTGAEEIVASPTASITSLAHVVVTGTMTGSVTEANVVSGGKTIILTVSNDTFVSFNDTIRQAIIDGMTSAQAQATGWNNEVRDKEVVGAVTRDSANQVTILLTAAAAYDTTASETITVTVPASALALGAAAVATPTVGVSADVGDVFGANEPSGMTVIENREFNSTTGGGVAGPWNFDFDSNGPEVIVSDAAAPQSPSNVLQFTHTAGQGAGGPNQNAGELLWSPKNIIYVYLSWKISSNWTGHPNSGINKMFFIKTNNPAAGKGPNQTFWYAKGRNAEPLVLGMTGQEFGCGSPFVNFDANLGDATLNRNQWYELEFLLTANTPNVANGKLEVWKDGVKTHNYTNFCPLASGEGPGFDGILVSLIWGGLGGTVPETMNCWFDHIYISGKD